VRLRQLTILAAVVTASVALQLAIGETQEEVSTMPLGDGIRRSIADVSQQERERLRDAFIALQQKAFPGNREDPPPAG
jgi:hypothetical protein